MSIDAVIFDCDGTLSHIEGIVELAKLNGVGAQVAELTEKAMSFQGMSPKTFEKRMDLVKPSYSQILTLGQLYIQHQAKNIQYVIQVLQQFKKEIFILSSGLLPAVKILAKNLKIPEKNIFAVDLFFDDQEKYLNFDTFSALIHHDGKKIILKKIKENFRNLIHVGDGQNDLVTKELVKYFVGYGGAYFREQIKKQSNFYITDMIDLLPICLTKTELLTCKKGDV